MFRTLIAALLITIVAASPIRGQDAHVWGFIAAPKDARLFFGIPDSHEITLSLICQPKRKRLQIVTTVLPPKAVAGRAATIRLSNGASKLDYSGKIERARDDIYVAATAPDTKVFGLLQAGSLLTIEVAPANQTIPLKGVAGPLARMEQACLGKR